MSQGRKVFEGPLSAIQQTKNWVRLRVNDFAAAVGLLRNQQLIVDELDGTLIALAENAKAEQVVRCLVQNGISVHEIAPHEQDLEAFYLSLMRKEQTPPSPPILPLPFRRGEGRGEGSVGNSLSKS
jgi:hypothetical protein